jgi:hypothetical protein
MKWRVVFGDRGTDKNGAKISVFGSDNKVNVTGSIGILPVH